MTNEAYEKQLIKTGTITAAMAVVANFIPGLYLWFFEGIVLDIGTILAIWATAAAAYGVSWIIQPISFYTTMGTAGTYISWIAGSGSDIRLPAATMAKKAAGVEDMTPEGDVMAAIGVCCSVFVSVSIVTLFTLIGVGILDKLPPSIISAFSYILPALFGAVYINLALKNLVLGGTVFLICVVFLKVIKLVPIPSGMYVLLCVILGILVAHVVFKTQNKEA